MFARLNHFKKPQNVNYLARFQTTPASQTWEFKQHLQISTHQLFPIFGNNTSVNCGKHGHHNQKIKQATVQIALTDK